MEPFFRTMAIFIAYPWLAALVGVLLLWLGLKHWRARLGTIAGGIAWLLYAVYETGMKQRWWCTGECNIRVDLLLIYPILLLWTVIVVVGLLRSGKVVGRPGSAV